MNKIKLYIYPEAKGHVHDDIPEYVNCVPLSKKGIADHCEVVPQPKDADYFYLGQFSDSWDGRNPSFHAGPIDRHIADIEGDWLGKPFPEWARKIIITINGLEENQKVYKAFVRPTFSVQLVDMARNREERFVFNNNKRFTFMGLPDPYNVRPRMRHAIMSVGLPLSVHFTDSFLARTHPKHPYARAYEDVMLNGTFALCPRGAGKDSIRLYEACFYGRVPVIVGDHYMVGEDIFDTSFAFRVSQYISDDAMAERFTEIYKTDLRELYERSHCAREYFDKIIRPYFQDPTLRFLEFLKRE